MESDSDIGYVKCHSECDQLRNLSSLQFEMLPSDLPQKSTCNIVLSHKTMPLVLNGGI